MQKPFIQCVNYQAKSFSSRDRFVILQLNVSATKDQKLFVIR